ncbi:MAG TPA: hypothetical protein PLU58_11040 [Saprospiraceae bacterium]|nr:hypothetical protein [Saprospiraceae bacterium]
MTTLPKDKHTLVIQGSEQEKQQACIEIRDWAVKNNITMPAILTYESILNFSHCNYILWNGTCLDACLRNFSVVGYTTHHTVESFIKVFEGEESETMFTLNEVVGLLTTAKCMTEHLNQDSRNEYFDYAIKNLTPSN